MAGRAGDGGVEAFAGESGGKLTRTGGPARRGGTHRRSAGRHVGGEGGEGARVDARGAG